MTDPYEFDSQTKFKDVPRARHGLPWEDRELNKLRSLYMQGETLQAICDLMERPKEGVLPKLASLGLITKQTNGFFWIWKRKVLPDAWKVSTPPENAYTKARKEEKVRRYMEAYGGNPAKPQSDDLKIYPYLKTFVDDLDNAVFKGAISGVATSPDLSGLGISTTGITTQLNPQTKLKFCKEDTFGNTPKETIMKFETRTFINDVEASTLTDDQIFGEIRRAEKRIEELKAIKTPTKKLADNITKLEEYAANLATYVDNR